MEFLSMALTRTFLSFFILMHEKKKNMKTINFLTIPV